ncbi:MAG: hypothetical protein UIC65_04590 [Alphaproteobacteria bacterium]|nr:hypothetical protein [Alphaproteobacteria bacterium]
MSRQIQIRRGDVAANDNFIGAIGEVTMDTTNNTLRVHDGQTLGGTTLAKQSEIPDLSPFDYVVAWQTPTAENNYTWYRKYKSGWVEQGGQVTIPSQNANTQINTVTPLPVKMTNQAYYVNVCFITDGGFTSGLRNNANGRGTDTLTISTYSTINISNSYITTWQVKGVAA